MIIPVIEIEISCYFINFIRDQNYYSSEYLWANFFKHRGTKFITEILIFSIFNIFVLNMHVKFSYRKWRKRFTASLFTSIGFGVILVKYIWAVQCWMRLSLHFLLKQKVSYLLTSSPGISLNKLLSPTSQYLLCS